MMKKHLAIALAAVIGVGAVTAGAADAGPRGATHTVASARVKCYGPYSKDKAMRMAKQYRNAGKDAWTKYESGGWYVCVKS